MKAKGLTAKEAKIVESCYFQPRYSGAGSRRFWLAVNRSPDRALYDFAAALMEMEARVLAVVNTHVRIEARRIVLKHRKGSR